MVYAGLPLAGFALVRSLEVGYAGVCLVQIGALQASFGARP